MKLLGKLIICTLLDIVLLSFTIVLQVIGYGTAPKIFATSEKQRIILIKQKISEYNNEYIAEIIIFGLLIFILDFLILKKITNKAIYISFIFLVMYVIISLTTLWYLSNNYL